MSSARGPAFTRESNQRLEDKPRHRVRFIPILLAGLPRPIEFPSIPMHLRARAALVVLTLIAARVFAADAAPLPLASAFPAPGATGVCPDTPLRLTFSAPPALGASGRIEIHTAANGEVVETIDVSARTAVKTIGGLPNYSYYPVLIDGNTATICPRNGVLAYGKSYYVTLDGGGSAAAADPQAWRFTTKSAPPAAGTTRLTVAADGRADFCTVQGALDFVPDGNTTPTTIFIRKGRYEEIVFFTNRHHLTLLGEDRHETVIAYANNDRFNNNSGGNPFGSANPNPAGAVRGRGAIYHRGMFMAHRVNDLTIANLTLRNTTPHGGSQAEAIILNGTPTAHAILKDVDLFSYQDTLQINGQAFLSNCYLEGDVDFMWGTGPCFFERCTARSVRSAAYYTQIRNPPTNHGYVYLHCTFDGPAGVTGNFLSRIQPTRFPASEVVLLDCVQNEAVGAVAWQLQGGGEIAQVHFWEWNSHTADGRPVDTAQRLAGSRQLRQPDDAATIANYSNPSFVLGGWDPRTAPIFGGAGGR